MLALIALMLAAAEAPQTVPFRLEAPATIIVRFKTVKGEANYSSLIEGAAPREQYGEEQRDFCVVLSRADGGYLADWRPLTGSTGECPTEPGYLIRTNAAFAPVAFENWPEVRAEVLESSDASPGLAEFLGEMPQDLAIQMLVEPAYLLAQGQGATVPSVLSEQLRWSEPVTFRFGAKGRGFSTRSFDGYHDGHAVVSWSRNSATDEEVRRDYCRYHIDPQSGLAAKMKCRIELEFVMQGQVVRRETRIIDVTQTLAR